MFSKKTNKKTKTKEGWGDRTPLSKSVFKQVATQLNLLKSPKGYIFPTYLSGLHFKACKYIKLTGAKAWEKYIFVKKNQSILCGYNSFENNLNAQCMTSNLWKTQIYPMQHPIKFTQVLQLASNVCYMYILLLVQAIERDLQHVITA